MNLSGSSNVEKMDVDIDAADTVEETALAEGFEVFGREGDAGFAIKVEGKMFYYKETREYGPVLFAGDELEEDGVALNDVSDIRSAVLTKLRPSEGTDAVA